MDGENSGQGCLFGWEHDPSKGKRGRPPHVRTTETANKIKLLLALGWANHRIANAIGVTEPTLRKHYFSELKAREMTRDAMNAARYFRLWQAAEAGNIGAEKAFANFLRENDAMNAGNQARTGEGERHASKPSVAKPVPLGKKEGAIHRAQQQIAGDPDLGSVGQRQLTLN